MTADQVEMSVKISLKKTKNKKTACVCVSSAGKGRAVSFGVTCFCVAATTEERKGCTGRARGGWTGAFGDKRERAANVTEIPGQSLACFEP